MSIADELIKGIPTAIVALIAVGIQYRQYKVAKAKLRLDLFDKRYALFLEVYAVIKDVSMNSVVVFDGKCPLEAHRVEARFLFGSEIEYYLTLMINQWLYLRSRECGIARSSQAIGVQNLPVEVEEDRRSELRRARILQDWFSSQEIDALYIFEKYLGFAEWRSRAKKGRYVWVGRDVLTLMHRASRSDP